MNFKQICARFGALLQQRWVWLTLSAICVVQFVFALIAQYLQHEQPCSLCLVQRVWIVLLAIWFGLNAWRRRLWTQWLVVLTCLAGLATCARHVWLVQHAGTAQCLPRFDVMWQYFPWTKVVTSLVTGDVSCTHAMWRLFGVAVPIWLALFYSGILAAVGFHLASRQGRESCQ